VSGEKNFVILEQRKVTTIDNSNNHIFVFGEFPPFDPAYQIDALTGIDLAAPEEDAIVELSPAELLAQAGSMVLLEASPDNKRWLPVLNGDGDPTILVEPGYFEVAEWKGCWVRVRLLGAASAPDLSLTFA
jgi:hypothetical protein